MRLALPSLAAACLLPGVACSSGAPGTTAHPASDAGADTHTGADAEAGPSFDPSSCAPPMRPSQLQQKCVPVGVSSTPKGFVPASDGWGFRAVRPTTPCTGATRGAIGGATCAPVDDCSAAFPPSTARVVVSGMATLPKGSVRAASLGDAVMAANDGDTIALDEGTYAESVSLTKNVTIVGRCASKVVVQGSAGSGISVTGKTLTLQSVSVEGFDEGVAVAGGTVNLSGVYLAGNANALHLLTGAKGSFASSAIDGRSPGKDPVIGVLVEAGASLTVDGVDVRGVDEAFTVYDAGSSLKVTSSIATSSLSNMNTFLVVAADDGSFEAKESVLSSDSGVVAKTGNTYSSSGGKHDTARVTIEDSEVDDTGAFFYGATLASVGGSTLTVTNTTIAHNSTAAILVGEAGCHATVTDVTIDGAKGSVASDGLLLFGGSTSAVTNTAVANESDNGIEVADPMTTVSVRASLVTGMVQGTNVYYSTPLITDALYVESSAAVTVNDCSFVDNQQVGMGVYLSASLDVSDSLVLNTKLGAGDHDYGQGLVLYQTDKATVTRTLIAGSAAAAVVLLYGGGVIKDSTFEDNPYVVMICGSSVTQTQPMGAPTPTQLVLLGDTYLHNGAASMTQCMKVGLPDAGGD